VRSCGRPTVAVTSEEPSDFEGNTKLVKAINWASLAKRDQAPKRLDIEKNGELENLGNIFTRST
jgi:hypothetical protein